MAEKYKTFSEKEIRQRARLIGKAKKAIGEIAPEWRNDPNVVTIGYGLRARKNRMEQEIVISFLVKKKGKDAKTIEGLGSRPVPEKIRGIGTDVVEIGKLERLQDEATGERDERAYDPLVGGIASSNADAHMVFWNGYGTLGSICFDVDTGDPMALSNWHVWAETGSAGDDIIQPGHPRSEDRVEAYFETFLCGPVANLVESEAPSAITTALAGAAAGVTTIAACADKKDLSRRGQENTVPGPDELTLKEKVNVHIDYKTHPIPGTPFKLKVKWDYARQTDKKNYEYNEEEDVQNEHVLVSKQIRPNKLQYRPGETVELYALIESEKPFPCDYYYALAYLIPMADESRKIPVVLHPSQCGAEKICVDFSADKPGTTLPGHFTRLGAEFRSPGDRRFKIVDRYQSDGRGELDLFPKAVFIDIPKSGAVEAHIVTSASPVGMEVYSGGRKIGHVLSPQEQGVVHVLRLEAEDIDQIQLYGGDNEASMLMFCYAPNTAVEGVYVLSHRIKPASCSQNRVCCFRGSITLDPKEMPGRWMGYLFVQTVNLVPEGTPPEEAAGLIGGIPVSQNMQDAAGVEDTEIECGACALVDFMFEVA
jgi:hypothetical protein